MSLFSLSPPSLYVLIHKKFLEIGQEEANENFALVGVMVPAFNSNTRWWISMSSRPAWSTLRVPGQPGLGREVMSTKQNKALTFALMEFVFWWCETVFNE